MGKGDDVTPLLKQFGDLRPSDFEQHPVWVSCHVIDYDEPWYDQTDEETFRAWTGHLPVDPSETMFLVRATLTATDGTRYSGFVTPQHAGGPADLATMQPQLFSESGKLIGFWCGMFEPDARTKAQIYSELNTDAKRLFPIRFAADAKLANGQVAGEIPGFCYLKKDKVVVTV